MRFSEYVTDRLLATRGDRLQVWREAEERFPLQTGVWSRVCRIDRCIDGAGEERLPDGNHPSSPSLMLTALRAITPSPKRKPTPRKRK